MNARRLFLAALSSFGCGISFGEPCYANPTPAGVTFPVSISPDTGQPMTTAQAELLKDIATLRAAKASGDKTSLYMAIAALLAFVLKWVVDFLQSLKADELTDKAKHAIPWLCSILGVVVAIAARYGMGESWTNSIILGGGAPGAVLWHELIQSFKGLVLKNPAGLAATIADMPKGPPPTPPVAA